MVTVSWLEPLQSSLGKSWKLTTERGAAAGHELTASHTAKKVQEGTVWNSRTERWGEISTELD